jgi:hypothetical protein
MPLCGRISRNQLAGENSTYDRLGDLASKSAQLITREIDVVSGVVRNTLPAYYDPKIIARGDNVTTSSRIQHACPIVLFILWFYGHPIHPNGARAHESAMRNPKAHGPADEVTSHLYSFGIRGKQFQFEGGKLPESVKFHGRLTDNDVRTIQKAGGRVEIVEAHFTAEELQRGASPVLKKSGAFR